MRQTRRLLASPDRGRLAGARWRQVRERVDPYAARITRLTIAAVIAYLLAQAFNPGNTDLTGPLTALLVVQATATSSLRNGLGRVAAVLTGVLVAIVLSTWVGLTWWSLGLAIGAALTLAHVMKLGDHILETPISAMLILGVAQHDVAAMTRIVNTLIGAGVGMAFNLAFPPPVRLAAAAGGVRDVSTGAARVLRIAGEQLEQGLDRRQIDDWLRDIHGLLPLVTQAEAAIAEAGERRRLNPRALVALDTIPMLTHGVRALDRTLLAVRQTLLAFQKELPADDEPQTEYDQELRRAMAVVLADMGAVIEAFGALTAAEANTRNAQAEANLEETLDMLRETQAMLTELCLIEPAADSGTWLLRGSILNGIENVLTELDLHARVRRPDTGAIPLKPLLERPGQALDRFLTAGQSHAAAQARRPPDPTTAWPALYLPIQTPHKTPNSSPEEPEKG